MTFGSEGSQILKFDTMKKNASKTAMMNWRLLVMIATLVTGTIYLNSCSDDETPTPAPTITLSSSTATNSPGQQILATVTVDAPAGGKTLSATVNGAADTSLPDVDLGGEKTKDVPVSYTIPSGAAVGS